MDKSDRKKEIIRLAHRYGELPVQELGDLLSISHSSIRRDLIALDQHRFVRRTRGGISVATTVNYEGLPYNGFQFNAKDARIIADLAAQMIEPGDVVGLSGGAICTQLALRVRMMEDITVVTNAVNIAVELYSIPGIQVRVIGGRLNPGSFELVGNALEASLQGVYIHKFFLGTDGLSLENGVTGHDEPEALSAQVMMSHAEATIVLADPSKFKRTSFAHVAPISAFNAIITSDLVPQNVRAEFAQTGIKLITPTD
jgi:DeoR/GlpR family transcriptional regulator of sugar metabolism